MTLFSRVTEICRERLPSIRVARITIDSIFDLDRMLQPGIRFGVTVRNTIELVGTPIASMGNFYFSVDVMDGDERWIIQKMENWRNGTYQAFYRIFYDEECVTRLDGVDGEELGWRNAYDVFQLNSLWEKKAGVYNLDYERPLPSGFYTLQTAVAAIPVSVKKQGLIIVFQSNHRVSDTYQFYGLLSEFDNLERWEKLIDDYDLQDARDYYNLTRNRPITNQEGDPLYYTMDYDPEQTELFAPAAVPSVLRKKGFILTFSPRYEEWESWQFIGTNIPAQFEVSTYWQKIYTAQSDFLNLTEQVPPTEGYYMLFSGSPGQIAVNHVPDDYRNPGVVITFFSGVVWELWQFIGTDAAEQWNNVDYWLKIPVGPSLALGEELGTAYEGSKGKANADEIASMAYKLEGIQDNAEVNQFAFSNIIVGSSTIASTTKTDTFELVEGSNITLSSSEKKITISSSNVDADFAALAGSTSQDFSTKTLNVADKLNVTGLASFASGVGVQGAAITIYGKDGQELPYLDFRHGVSGSALSRIISLNPGELSIFGKQVNGAVQPDGKIKLKNDTYAEKALYIGGASGAKLVYVAASGDTPAYLKLQNHDGGVMHFVTTGGQTMHSEGVPAAIEEHLLEAHSGVYNLTVNVPPTDDFYTLSVQSLASQYAPTNVPVGVRKVGLIITFRSHSEWETWQFVGAMESFLLPGDWKRIDSFIETGAYDMDAEHPLYNVGHYQLSNNDDPFYIPSVIPINSRVAFMKVRYINSYGQRVILRYASSDFAHFHDYVYWDVLKVSDLSSADIEKMLTGLITTHYHDTVQTDRVTPVEAVNAPIARSFSLDPHSAGQGYLIITDAYTFSTTITIELTMSYLIQDSFYRYVLYIDMRHSGPLQLAITKDGDDIILKGDSTLNMSLEKGIYKIEFIRQMSSGTDLVLYARHDFIPDDVL